jgi:hypothetical protein
MTTDLRAAIEALRVYGIGSPIQQMQDQGYNWALDAVLALLDTAPPAPAPLDVAKLLALLGPSHPHDEGRECGACKAYNLLAARAYATEPDRD